jgi:hypothetical protein
VNSLKVLGASTAGGKLLINPKFGHKHWQDNALGFIAMSNKKNCLTVDPAEGRYFVLESWIDPKSKEYYQAYYAWLQYGGSRRVLNFLLKRDLAGFSGQILPFKTQGFLNLCEQAKPDYERALLEMIDGGISPFNISVFTFQTLRSQLRGMGYRAGDKNVARVLTEAGFVKYENNVRRTKRKLWKVPNYWSRQNAGDSPSERYDFYLANALGQCRAGVPEAMELGIEDRQEGDKES